jgi:hypothetical protein
MVDLPWAVTLVTHTSQVNDPTGAIAWWTISFMTGTQLTTALDACDLPLALL